MVNRRLIRQILLLASSWLALTWGPAGASAAPAASRTGSSPLASGYAAGSAPRRAENHGDVRSAIAGIVAGQATYERLTGAAPPNGHPDATDNARLPECPCRLVTVSPGRPERPHHLHCPRHGAVPSAPRAPPLRS